MVVAWDPFGDGTHRPYLIISYVDHPFLGEEYVAAVVTTTERDRAVPLADDSFTEGSLPRCSFISPWNPVAYIERKSRPPQSKHSYYASTCVRSSGRII